METDPSALTAVGDAVIPDWVPSTGPATNTMVWLPAGSMIRLLSEVSVTTNDTFSALVSRI